ncbi:M29 family metallopeptidase [Pseudomonas fragi]|uniref:hypothetical protein n=1 Tax=Pseudomonas fragi TaxID=296 RepID=UPI00382A31B3
MPTKNALFDLKAFWVISDNETFLQDCCVRGFHTQELSKLENLPAQSLIFSFCNDAAKRTFELAKRTPCKQSIFCAVHVFEASVKSALYGLDLILKSDFNGALQKQHLVLESLDTYKQFHLKGANSKARVVIMEQSTPYAMIKEDIDGNFIHSIAEFFELHYAHMNPQSPCPFLFNGHLKIAGILTVRRKLQVPPDDDLKEALQYLSQKVSHQTAILTIKNNTVTSFKVNHTEYRELLKRAAGPRSLKLTEFAVGVNSAIGPFIDYCINSQMNEGISGVHVALGDGSSGYHIDFLSPDVTFSPFQGGWP